MKFMLLLCALIVGSGTMWAAENDTHDFSQSLSQLLNNNAAISSIEIAAQNYPVKKVVVSYRYNKTLTNAVTVAVSVGGNSWGSSYVVGTGSNYTTMEFSGNATTGAIVISFTNNTGDGTGHGTFYVDNVQLTEGASGSSLANSDFALTGAPVSLNFDLYNNSSAQTVNFTTSSTGAVTVSESDYVTTIVDATNKTITVTPKKVTPATNAEIITVSQAADDTYKAGSATFTVTITDSTPIPTHTATFSVNGATTSQDFEEGAAITFPANPAAIEGKSFVGWTTTAIDGTTDEAPTFVTSATMGNSDVTYYAVFATIEGESGWSETALANITSTDIFVFSNGSYAMSNNNGTGSAPAAVSITVSEGKITSEVAGNLKWNVSGNATDGYTFYPNETTETWLYCNTTASSSSNNNIRVGTGDRKIWKFDNNNYLVTNDNSTKRYLSIYDDSDFRGYVNTSNGAFVPKFYKYSEGTCSGYCTTVEARAEAELSFAQAAQTAEVYFASQYTGQGLTNPHSVSPITWTSSNENVATVNENGTVTVIAVGETTITASFAGNGDYNAGEASYTLTVQDSRADAGISYTENEVMVELKDGTYDAIYNTSNPLNNSHNLTNFTWTSSNEDVATVNQSGVVTLKAVGETIITASFAGNTTYKPSEASFTLQVVDYRQDATVTWKNANNETITMLDVEKGQYKENFFTVNCNVSGFEFTSSFITQAWDYNKSMPATYIKNENAFSLTTLAVGTTTITATFPGNDTYKPASATLTINVTGGTATAPYSVAEARDAIDAGTGVNGVFAKGIVSEIVTAYNSDYGNISYNISDDGTTTSAQLQAYRGKSYNGDDFTSDDDIQVGDVVTIYGNLTKHNSTYEFAQNNQLYFNQPRLTVADEDKTVTVNAAGTITSHKQQTIKINYRNFTTAPSANNVSVVFCEENGTLKAEGYDWINSITYNGGDDGYFTMNCSFAENTGDTRTGYAEVAVTVGSTIYYSDIITITQAAPVTSHNVTFSVNGTVTAPESYEEGAAITFPEVSDIDGMTFLGWTDNEISGTQASANYVTEATMGNADVTYYAVFALLVPGTSTTYTDELTHDLIGVTGTSYSNWSGITDNSGAVYAGNSAGGNTAIQLRTNNSNSGIVTTASGGKLKKVTVEWNSNTADERTLDIYGKNNEYESASDLYNSNLQGTNLGSISNGTTMALSINGDYEYVGLRSNNGAMYLDKITIEWESGTPDSYTDYCTTIPEMLTVTIAKACTDGKGKYYGTFSSSSAFKVSGNVTVSEIGINNDGTMNVQSYEEGAVVPANTGVMISATAYGDFKLIKSEEEGTSVLGNNRLRPSGDNGITADGMNEANADLPYKFYRLTMHDGTKLGFWWGATGGAAFAVAPNKAYLAVPASVAGARSGFAFDDETTGISNVNVNLNDNENYYDLQGRKVSKPGKGLYIVNGRKVVIK